MYHAKYFLFKFVYKNIVQPSKLITSRLDQQWSNHFVEKLFCYQNNYVITVSRIIELDKFLRSSWYKMSYGPFLTLIRHWTYATWHMCVTSGRNRSYPDRMDEFQWKCRDKFEQYGSVSQEESKTQKRERKREGERFAIASSHLIGDGSRHRVGPPSWPV